MIHVYHKESGGVWYGAAIQDRQVLATYFSIGKPGLEHIMVSLPYDAPFQVVEEPDQLLVDVVEALEEIFKGKDSGSYGFKLGLGQRSGYTRRVLDCNSLVPVGYVTSYGAVAKAAGGSARSVGQVEATNPVPLLIPCHRVVCSDLSLGGYGGGQKLKLEILQREKRGYKEPKTVEVNGKKLALFPVEWIKPKS